MTEEQWLACIESGAFVGTVLPPHLASLAPTFAAAGRLTCCWQGSRIVLK